MLTYKAIVRYLLVGPHPCFGLINTTESPRTNNISLCFTVGLILVSPLALHRTRTGRSNLQSLILLVFVWRGVDCLRDIAEDKVAVRIVGLRIISDYDCKSM